MPLDEPVTDDDAAREVDVAHLELAEVPVAGDHRGRIPHCALHSCPGCRSITSLPVRSAFGGQVIGSMATARRRRDTSGSVSPVYTIR